MNNNTGLYREVDSFTRCYQYHFSMPVNRHAVVCDQINTKLKSIQCIKQKTITLSD